jgi:hypothetical protein
VHPIGRSTHLGRPKCDGYRSALLYSCLQRSPHLPRRRPPGRSSTARSTRLVADKRSP